MANKVSAYIYSIPMANSGKISNAGSETVYFRLSNPQGTYVCDGPNGKGLTFTLFGGKAYYPDLSVSCNPATIASVFEDNAVRDINYLLL